MQATQDDLLRMKGAKVYARNGEEIGKIDEVYVDVETHAPEWIGIGTGLFGSKKLAAPVRGSRIDDGVVTVPFAKETVETAPQVDSDEIADDEERHLYAHYGLLSEEGEADREGDGDAEMLRSEEELDLEKRSAPAGRVRVRKVVESEPVSVDVDLKREKAVITREPASGEVAGKPLGDEEVEVPLRAEEALIEKRPVVRERIAVGKETETETRRVEDEVRKERVEVEENEPR